MWAAIGEGVKKSKVYIEVLAGLIAIAGAIFAWFSAFDADESKSAAKAASVLALGQLVEAKTANDISSKNLRTNLLLTLASAPRLTSNDLDDWKTSPAQNLKRCRAHFEKTVQFRPIVQELVVLGHDLSNENFRGWDLRGLNFSNAKLNDIRFVCCPAPL